ncbi:MAG: hypothetical protein WAN22_17320 [Solirubrobacteraceae bacterium]
MKLWASGELLVKLIVTVPAFAVSVLLVNLSAPLGSAESVSVLLAPVAALDVLADVEVVPVAAAVLVALVAAAVLDVVLLLLLEPPHALRPSISATTAKVSRSVLGTSHISLLFDRLTV